MLITSLSGPLPSSGVFATAQISHPHLIFIQKLGEMYIYKDAKVHKGRAC